MYNKTTYNNDSTPVEVSYGVIAYHINNNEKSLLFHKARDSYAFIDFILGNYKENKIYYLFKNMTTQEIQRISQNVFKELWNDFIVPVDDNVAFFKKRYTESENKYNHIAPCIYLKIKNLLYNNTEKELQYGFPKGKRDFKKMNETPFETAIREFVEETTLPIDNFIFKNEHKVVETRYMGSDNKKYRVVLFLIECKEKLTPIINKRTDESIRKMYISQETGSVTWIDVNKINKNEILPYYKKIVDEIITFNILH